jgi:superfamily II DNA or RNA helicase
MKLIKREPGVGYIDNWLWMPKTHISQMQVESALTFFGRDSMPIEAWYEEPHHFRIPRNYLSPQALGQLKYPVVDARFRNFPRVTFNSRVTLDAKEPDKYYQRQGSAALLAVTDGILCLRCGAGKTVVGLHTAAQLGAPILINVTDGSLAEQWGEEVEDWLGIPIDSPEIGWIGGDRGKAFSKNPDSIRNCKIVIAHVQTLARRIEEGALPAWMPFRYGVCLFDEAHVMGAPYFSTVAPAFHGRRWGLTATPDREDQFDPLLRHIMGQVVYTYLTPDLKPLVYFRQLPTVLDLSSKTVFESTHDKTKEFHFGMTYGYLAREHVRRTQLMVQDIQDAVDAGRHVLVLTHSIEMTERLGRHFPNGGVVNSSVKGKERRRRIRDCNPVISIMQLGKQALNKPVLDTLYVTEPFSKAGILQQTMGRVLRKFHGKKQPLVIFFEDVYIKELSKLCGKLRHQLNRWPPSKGGKIPYKVIKTGKTT